MPGGQNLIIKNTKIPKSSPIADINTITVENNFSSIVVINDKNKRKTTYTEYALKFEDMNTRTPNAYVEARRGLFLPGVDDPENFYPVSEIKNGMLFHDTAQGRYVTFINNAWTTLLTGQDLPNPDEIPFVNNAGNNFDSDANFRFVNGQVLIPPGSLSDPGLAIASDTSTGLAYTSGLLRLIHSGNSRFTVSNLAVRFQVALQNANSEEVFSNLGVPGAGFNAPSSATVATDDNVLIFDTSDSNIPKSVTVQSITDLGLSLSGNTTAGFVPRTQGTNVLLANQDFTFLNGMLTTQLASSGGITIKDANTAGQTNGLFQFTDSADDVVLRIVPHAADRGFDIGSPDLAGDMIITLESSDTNASFVLTPKGTGTVQTSADHTTNISANDDIITKGYADANYSGSVSFGTTTQVPYTNVAGNDYIYSSDFTFDGSQLMIPNGTVALPGLIFAGASNIGFSLSGSTLQFNVLGGTRFQMTNAEVFSFVNFRANGSITGNSIVVDNITIDVNTFTATNANGNLIFSVPGTGTVQTNATHTANISAADDVITKGYADANYGTSGNTLDNGTYTPSTFSPSNITSSTSRLAHYQRIGEIVYVKGSITINWTTAASLTSIELSLPVASNLPNGDAVNGTLWIINGSSSPNVIGSIIADTLDDRVILQFFPPTGAGTLVEYSFSYRVV